MATIDDILSAIDSGQKAALDRLFAFLSIPSISAVPAHFPDCERAADWLVTELGDLGFEAAKRPTAGRPMVVGHIKAARREAPHVLFYGHYDVQPVDPLDLWRNPPFEPKLEAGPHGEEIVARGACDDKGQLMTFLEACRAFKQFGGPPCHITVLFEGEEETGSPSLPAFLAENAKELKADVALVCDTGMWDRSTPAITIALRGIAAEEVILPAPIGICIRASTAAWPSTRSMCCRRSSASCTTIPAPSPSPASMTASKRFRRKSRTNGTSSISTARAFLREVGLTTPAGERDRSPLEILWSRPTCEVNGIVGGYTGEGTKTVLPAKASAKITFRLVGKQNPERILEAFRAFVTSRLPPDVKAEFLGHGGSPAISLPIKNQALRIARRALETEWEKPAALVGSGGSIPIVGSFKRELNLDSLLVGFALDDDRIHSPNEKYDRTSFHKGARSWARILAAIGA